MTGSTYKVTAIRRPTTEQIATHERVKAMQANQLPVVRKAAEKWRNGLGLSGAAVAAASLLTSPEVLATASESQRIQGGWVVLAALVATLVAVGGSLRASFGWPKIQSLSLNKVKAWERAEVRKSIWWLQTSMIATLVAIVAASAGVAVLLFGFVLP
ncbi:hypothetical protein [Microbacterium sp. NPDC087589]|uniref:hypothetical protein n=1 Tax=Microbacterium sp. NPDC087589 TaxID=3364191 RepID=UPI0037FC477F